MSDEYTLDFTIIDTGFEPNEINMTYTSLDDNTISSFIGAGGYIFNFEPTDSSLLGPGQDSTDI